MRPEFAFEDSLDDDGNEDEDDDPKRWLHVWPTGSQPAYNDMLDFAATPTNDRLGGRLDRALDGERAFRKFKDVLCDWPEDHDE